MFTVSLLTFCLFSCSYFTATECPFIYFQYKKGPALCKVCHCNYRKQPRHQDFNMKTIIIFFAVVRKQYFNFIYFSTGFRRGGGSQFDSKFFYVCYPHHSYLTTFLR